VRVAPLGDDDVRTFVRHPRVVAWFERHGVQSSEADRVARAAGAPGALLASAPAVDASQAARALLDAADHAARADWYRLALRQGSAGARGAYADTLDAIIALLHARARDAARSSDVRAARAAADGVRAVEDAKGQASGNVNPQLITASLLRALAGGRA
jgi:hypothetical protein